MDQRDALIRVGDDGCPSANAVVVKTESRKGIREPVTQALILGGLSIIGAIAAMAFEVGYSKLYFNVPIELIVIDAQRVMVVGFLCLMSASPLFLYVLISFRCRTDKRAIIKLVGAAMIASIPFAISLQFFAAELMLWLVAIAIIGSSVFLGVCFSLYVRIKHGWSITAGLACAADETANIYSGFASDQPPTWFDGVVACILLLALPLIYVMATGATLPDYFRHSVLADKPNYVFVRRYGDNFVFKEFNTVTGDVLDGIEIRSLQSGSPLAMKECATRLKRAWFSRRPQSDANSPADALAPENALR